IWIGTNGGGLIHYDRRSNSFVRYMHDPDNANSLGHDVIVSLVVDHAGKLWIGTYFGGVDSFHGNDFTYYRHDQNGPGAISADNGRGLIEDAEHDRWAGTRVGGLNRFDRATGTFTRYSTEEGIRAGCVPVLLEDNERNMWV